LAAYTIRVQLNGDASYEQYEKLHTLMSQMGFGRTVTGSKTIDLPHATYYGHSAADVSSVRDTVQSNVKARIQSSILVFVAKTETWAMGW
jgi:hypothetical protein